MPLWPKYLREPFGLVAVKDIPLPDSSFPPHKEQANSLGLATEEYRGSPVSPERVTTFWQAFWAENGRKVGISISVPECPFTGEQLENIRIINKGPIYIPNELSTQRDRHLLGKMFPKMQSYSVEEGNTVTNEVRSGWRQFDMSVDAPHLGTDENQLREVMVSQGDEEPSLNEYIVASQASKLLTGKYLDEGTRSRIFGSRYDGVVVHAHFLSGGYLRVDSLWDSGGHRSDLGGRFSRGVN